MPIGQTLYKIGPENPELVTISGLKKDLYWQTCNYKSNKSAPNQKIGAIPKKIGPDFRIPKSPFRFFRSEKNWHPFWQLPTFQETLETFFICP